MDTRVPVKQGFDLKAVNRLIADIRPCAKALADEISRDLKESDPPSLRKSTHDRLARWCHPQRMTDREATAMPLAKRIRELLFGEVTLRDPANQGPAGQNRGSRSYQF